MMASTITTGAVHHITLTVSDVARSSEFYTGLLGFKSVASFGQRTVLSNGQQLLVLTPPPDPARALPSDQFNENRIGLDHLSLSVSSTRDLEDAVQLFKARGVTHGEVKDLGPDFGIHVLAFRDPDNIQIELTAPYRK